MSIDTTIALVSLSDARIHCAIDTGDMTYNADLENLINSVSAFFNLYTNRHLLSISHTEYYDGDGSNVQYLNNYPITAVTSLYIDANHSYGSNSLIDKSEYIVYEDIGKIVLLNGVFDKGAQSVKIVYTAGYTSVPHDLRQACLDQIKFQFLRWKNNREGILSVTLEGQSVSMVEVKDLLPSVRIVLDRYVRMRHGS